MTNSGSLQITTPNDLDIVMTRAFNAPRPLVWEAMSKPEFIRRWLLGPPGWTMEACDDDLRVGGEFHWSWRGPENAEMSMRGTYREVQPPERIVRTETFEFGCNAQAGEQLASVVLTDQGDTTMLTMTVTYPSKEARNGALASGMEQGVSASYNRLDEILSSSAAEAASS
ncbi:MAG TPA: SRPBCC family protein [Pyrinomonadaceae bacterium]|nr:SRPBCC family protein [Pyrinomonadaceae bacterium]